MKTYIFCSTILLMCQSASAITVTVYTCPGKISCTQAGCTPTPIGMKGTVFTPGDYVFSNALGEPYNPYDPTQSGVSYYYTLTTNINQTWDSSKSILFKPAPGYNLQAYNVVSGTNWTYGGYGLQCYGFDDTSDHSGDVDKCPYVNIVN